MSHWEAVGGTRQTGGRNCHQGQAEEKDSKLRPDKPTRRTPESSSQPKRRDTLVTEVKSPSKTQLVRGGLAPGQAHANKLYSFKDEHLISLFKLLQKSNILKLLEVRRPKDAKKSNDPCFYLYHRMLGHPTKNCCIFKDVPQALIDAEVLRLRPEQNKVTTNMIAMLPIQFDRNLPLAPTGVAPILKGEQKVINMDPHNQKEKGLIPVLTS